MAKEVKGLGHAIYSAMTFVGNEQGFLEATVEMVLEDVIRGGAFGLSGGGC